MLSEYERRKLASYIPRYNGYCPKLKSEYGRTYGSETRDMFQDLKATRIKDNVVDDYTQTAFKSIEGEEAGPSSDVHDSPKYCSGYTGFVPTIQFRYGKCYERSVDDSIFESAKRQRVILDEEEKIDRPVRSKSVSCLTNFEVQGALNDYYETHRYNAKPALPESAPIHSYHGYSPNMKDQEESSQWWTSGW